MIFIDEAVAKYFFNSLENCNSNYDFFNAGVNYVLQELAKKETEKENKKNNVYDIFKSIDKYADKTRNFFSGVHIDAEKQCKVYTNGKYCIIENCLITDTTKTVDKNNNVIDCNYPNYLKVINCNDDISKNDFYFDCFIKQLNTFDKLTKEKKDIDDYFVHFDIFANKEKQIVINQRIAKKLAYWCKCHSNINIMFECFSENKNYVQKIKLFDDKNNTFVTMCATEFVYESLFNPDKLDIEYIDKTMFLKR